MAGDKKPEYVRLSVNLSPEVAEDLETMAREKGTTITETIRRAIATEKFVSEAVNRGEKILVADKNDKMKEVLFR